MPFGPQTIDGKPRKADPVRIPFSRVLVLHSFSFMQLWVSIKAVKAKLASILHDISAHLKRYAEACDTPESRNMFLKDCESITKQDAEVSLHLPMCGASLTRGTVIALKTCRVALYW